MKLILAYIWLIQLCEGRCTSVAGDHEGLFHLQRHGKSLDSAGRRVEIPEEATKGPVKKTVDSKTLLDKGIQGYMRLYKAAKNTLVSQHLLAHPLKHDRWPQPQETA